MIDTKILAPVGGEMKEIAVDDAQKVSDGYHTFEELYGHRVGLWIALCHAWATMNAVGAKVGSGEFAEVWRSKKHSDGGGYDGWFLLGLFKKAGSQMTYHVPLSYWDQTEFAETLEQAPEFDGHTSADVLERMKML